MISIIITAYKEHKTLAIAINSFLSQNLNQPFEILIICPDPETTRVANLYSKKYKNIIHIKDPNKGKPTALNLAFKRAKGDILILSDGDVYVDKNSVNKLLKFFKDKKVGAVTGRPIPVDNRKNLLGYWAHLLNEAAHQERLLRDQKQKFLFCSGYLFAMRKGIVKKIPPFVLDDAYISKLIWKPGYKIRYSPNSKVYIKNPSTLKDWINQKRRNALGHYEADLLLGSDKMKSLKNEILHGTFKALSYPRNPLEFFYTLLLFPARLLIWLLSFYDIKIKKKTSVSVWKRVESTK